MERYGSDTDADDQEKPLLRRGHEDKVQRGERRMCPANWRANGSGASRRAVSSELAFSLFDGFFLVAVEYLDGEETCQTPARCRSCGRRMKCCIRSSCGRCRTAVSISVIQSLFIPEGSYFGILQQLRERTITRKYFTTQILNTQLAEQK